MTSHGVNDIIWHHKKLMTSHELNDIISSLRYMTSYDITWSIITCTSCMSLHDIIRHHMKYTTSYDIIWHTWSIMTSYMCIIPTFFHFRSDKLDVTIEIFLGTSIISFIRIHSNMDHTSMWQIEERDYKYSIPNLWTHSSSPTDSPWWISSRVTGCGLGLITLDKDTQHSAISTKRKDV